VNTLLVATRHHLHARQVIAGLEAGKHVFCEKPLCLTRDELDDIVRANAAATKQLLMVGYNRRFSPMSLELRSFFSGLREPIAVQYRVNAGPIPPEHWVHDLQQGGGRILGEVCHFVDYLIFVTGAMPISVFATALPSAANPPDSVAVTVTFDNGSIGMINYIAEGDKSFSKERVEVYGGGRVAALDDFRSLELVHNGRRTMTKSSLRQDKGHSGEWRAFGDAIRKGGNSPISMRELVAGMLATFAINESLQQAAPIPIDVDALLTLEP
jgi:predicted dehydrogenase